MNLHTFDKVTAFVLRNRGGNLEILTFLHPLAGRQIPAGSIEQGELPVDAARREVMEETGIDNLDCIVRIGEWIETLEGEAVALFDTTLTDGEGREIDLVKRGHRVRVEQIDGSRARLHRVLYDFNVEPPMPLPVDVGWAKMCHFGTSIRRYFFVSSIANDERISWQQYADGHDFKVEWQPLDQSLTLVSDQAEWLASHLDKIKAHWERIA